MKNNITKMPEDTVPWSTLFIGQCWMCVTCDKNVYIKLRDYAKIEDYNACINDGEFFRFPKNPEMQVIPVDISIQWKVKRGT